MEKPHVDRPGALEILLYAMAIPIAIAEVHLSIVVVEGGTMGIASVGFLIVRLARGAFL